ncbi:hypothetical protein WJX72_004987 [[Myrmecia] bisecta]|uniref:PHD-type domain-containing protein n=1 Tax=[Myrmecia] bisecta TaxID=41462 RepID=A0AAW1PSZ7_9CHLO
MGHATDSDSRAAVGEQRGRSWGPLYGGKGQLTGLQTLPEEGAPVLVVVKGTPVLVTGQGQRLKVPRIGVVNKVQLVGQELNVEASWLRRKEELPWAARSALGTGELAYTDSSGVIPAHDVLVPCKVFFLAATAEPPTMLHPLPDGAKRCKRKGYVCKHIYTEAAGLLPADDVRLVHEVRHKFRWLRTRSALLLERLESHEASSSGYLQPPRAMTLSTPQAAVEGCPATPAPAGAPQAVPASVGRATTTSPAAEQAEAAKPLGSGPLDGTNEQQQARRFGSMRNKRAQMRRGHSIAGDVAGSSGQSSQRGIPVLAGPDGHYINGHFDMEREQVLYQRKWVAPETFVQKAGLPAKDWKSSLRVVGDSQGRTLAQYLEESCAECGSPFDEPLLLMCSNKRCEHLYHTYCLQPPMLQMPPDEVDWFCPLCEEGQWRCSDPDWNTRCRQAV